MLGSRHFLVQSGTTAYSNAPYVSIVLGAEEAQHYLSPAGAMRLGQELIRAAESVVAQSFLSSYLAHLGLEEKDIVEALGEYQRCRDNSFGPLLGL